MKALVARQYGAPESLAIADVEAPVPGPGQVLVEVEAASVNPFDLQIMLGYLKERISLEFPYVVGMDCAGKVAAAGDGVTRFAVGDQIFGMLRDTPGSVAEYALASAASPLVERRPATLDPVRAAAIPEVGLTALTLMRAARLQTGEKALIVGATGGVGMVLVPLAAAAGAEVIATAGAADVEYVRGLGAASTVDYTAGDPTTEALARHPEGVDVLLNLALTGPALVDATRVIRRQGRLVSAPPIWDVSPFREDLTVTSPFLSAEPGDLEDLAVKVISDRLPVEINQVYQLSQAGEAFVDHLRGHSRGKRVIAVR